MINLKLNTDKFIFIKLKNNKIVYLTKRIRFLDDYMEILYNDEYSTIIYQVIARYQNPKMYVWNYLTDSMVWVLDQ